MKRLVQARLHLSRYGKATLRWLFTIGAVVNFAVAGSKFADDPLIWHRLIAWGLFDLAVLFLFFDRDNPPDAELPTKIVVSREPTLVMPPEDPS